MKSEESGIYCESKQACTIVDCKSEGDLKEFLETQRKSTGCSKDVLKYLNEIEWNSLRIEVNPKENVLDDLYYLEMPPW